MMVRVELNQMFNNTAMRKSLRAHWFAILVMSFPSPFDILHPTRFLRLALRLANTLGPLFFRTRRNICPGSRHPGVPLSYLFRNQIHLFPATDDPLWSIAFSLTVLVVGGGVLDSAPPSCA